MNYACGTFIEVSQAEENANSEIQPGKHSRYSWAWFRQIHLAANLN